eukprot:scaffold77599_cov33-Tisochrysis_lutea.AAC.6
MNAHVDSWHRAIRQAAISNADIATTTTTYHRDAFVRRVKGIGFLVDRLPRRFLPTLAIADKTNSHVALRYLMKADKNEHACHRPVTKGQQGASWPLRGGRYLSKVDYSYIE